MPSVAPKNSSAGGDSWPEKIRTWANAAPQAPECTPVKLQPYFPDRPTPPVQQCHSSMNISAVFRVSSTWEVALCRR
eukprot:gene19271-biopygen944